MKGDFKNKRVTVVGLARSGMAAALLLRNLGAKVYATDSGDSDDLRKNGRLLAERGIETEIGAHTRDFIKDKDLIVVSPGVAEDSPALVWARQEKVPVIGEVELGYLCCEAPIVAITGTNGKSTTTTLIGEILKKNGTDAVVCGNIGNPFCGELYRINKDSVVVLEISSFQLETIKEFRPYIAVFLNISQNHFDRHPDFDSYLKAKARIFINQKETDSAVLNYDDPLIRALKEKTRAGVLSFSCQDRVAGAYLKDGVIRLVKERTEEEICGASEIKIKGRHNVENALAAACATSVFGVGAKKMKEAFTEFKGLEHRFEYVTSIDGTDFINDSKGTTVLAAVMALESCDKPVILIAGGHDKGSDFSKARGTVASKVKKLVLIGEAKEKIRQQLGDLVPVIEAKSMDEAVKEAYTISLPGDCVLLSPMCASFDMFRNFEERGRTFKEAVLKIKDRSLINLREI